MSDELFAVLVRFHREVSVPEVREAIDGLRGEVSTLRSDMLGHFDAMYGRFARLESEYEAPGAALSRLEWLRAVSRLPLILENRTVTV